MVNKRWSTGWRRKAYIAGAVIAIAGALTYAWLWASGLIPGPHATTVKEPDPNVSGLAAAASIAGLGYAGLAFLVFRPRQTWLLIGVAGVASGVATALVAALR